MTKCDRQEKRLLESVSKLNDEDCRVLNLILFAILSGGESHARVDRCADWLKTSEGRGLSHADKLMAMEAIATGSLDILPDYLVDVVRENVFCTREGGAA